MIYDPSYQPDPQMYDVRVGYTRVQVPAQTREDAIRIAREQLCLQMPRMWDVISAMADTRFEVDVVEDVE